ncbi:MAG: hypothetical protein MZW92_63960 [Comamonadaceae bacterium]|nr:hypothetical protein [Comamonadaceae bacterium]
MAAALIGGLRRAAASPPRHRRWSSPAPSARERLAARVRRACATAAADAALRGADARRAGGQAAADARGRARRSRRRLAGQLRRRVDRRRHPHAPTSRAGWAGTRASCAPCPTRRR